MNGCNGANLSSNSCTEFQNLLGKPVEIITAYSRNNVQKCEDLAVSISESPYWKITSIYRNDDTLHSLHSLGPIEGRCNKLRNYYLNAQKENKRALAEFEFKYNSQLAQDAEFHLQIEELQKALDNDKFKLNKTQDEYKVLKADCKRRNSALSIANDMFATNFQMHIDIENDSDSVFVAVVYFNSMNKDFPIKCTISLEQKEIIDFDARSILTEDEENEIKAKLKETGDILDLSSTLRKKVMAKIS